MHLFNNQVIYDNITNTFINYIKAEVKYCKFYSYNG